MITRKTLLRFLAGAICIALGVCVGLYDYISLKYRKPHVTREAPTEEEAEEEECISPGPTDETLEIKRGDRFSRRDIIQTLAYLKKSNLQLGILARFSSGGMKFKRIVNIF